MNRLLVSGGWGRAVCLALLAGVAWSAPERPYQDPARLQADAYVYLIQADQAMDEEAYGKAVVAYREALDRYNRLAAEFPEWEARIVQYRQTYCANQLLLVTRKTGRAENEWLAEQLKSGQEEIPSAYRERYAAALEENKYLKQKLAQLEDALHQLEGQAEAVATAQRLEAENAQLAAQLRDGAGLLETNRTLQAAQEKLEAAYEELAAKQDDTARQNKQLTQQSKAAQERAIVMENQLAEAQAAGLQLAATMTNLEARLQQAGEQEATLRAEFASQSEALAAAKETLQKRDQSLKREKARSEALAATNKWLQAGVSNQLAETTRLQAQLEAQLAATASLEKALAGAETRRLEEQQAASNTLAAAHSDLAQAAAEAGQWETQARQAERAGKALGEKYAALETQHAQATQALATVQAENQALSQERDALQIKARELEQAHIALAELRQEVALLRSRGRKDLSPEEVKTLLQEGLTQERKHAYDRALLAYDQVIVADAKNLEALQARGRCLLHLSRENEALAALVPAHVLAPNDVQVQLLLGTAYCRVQQYDEAARLLRHVVTQEPGNSTARNLLGAAYLGLGRMSAAREELEEAIKLDPTLREAQLNLAQACFFSTPAEADKARQHYQRALELGAATDPRLEKMLNP